MQSEQTLFYFGYGSNLFVPRIVDRIASAKTVGTAAVSGYRLKFNKQGHDGSAKANMCFTGNSIDVIRGAIYEMDASQKPVLDAIEGIETDRGYTPRELNITTDNGDSISVFVYIADQWMRDSSLKPYTWYRDLCLFGARSHGFPKEYCESVVNVAATQDLDNERDRLNRYGQI
ncbi:MAG: gamma-glutamylcyclotransferase family protein [Pseudomonadota bacterium]